MKLKLPRKTADFLLIGLSSLAFWYAYFCYKKETISLRGSRFDRYEDPFFFWCGVLFLSGSGLYFLYLVFLSEEE
jgi:hypothetical protein